MSDTTETPISSTEKERDAVLHRIWLAQAKALAQTLENTPAAELQAATLNVARQFLSDNGINSDSLKQHTREASAWASSATALYGKSVDELDEWGQYDKAEALPPADPE